MRLRGAQITLHRLLIITGHYGTGKTEFSVNLALDLAEAGEKVRLADLDIVNPYFRSRERKRELTAAGVQVITSSQACSDADVPALPAELLTVFQDQTCRGVLDIGGDPDGARVLARFQPQILREDYQMLFVSNANRPEVRTPERALACLRGIAAVTGLRCGGIVSNTHLCGETTPEEVRKGARLAEELSRETRLPVLCHVAEEGVAAQLDGWDAPVYPITIRMKKPWEVLPTGKREGGPQV